MRLKGVCKYDQVRALEMGRLSWPVQVSRYYHKRPYERETGGVREGEVTVKTGTESERFEVCCWWL